MNKAITDGVVLMPTPFSAGLNVWSQGDGTPGSDTYDGLASAAYVPADQDFGGCLELQKTSGTQKLRYMGQTPLEPGCYLKITARVKAISGNLPSVRIAGWAGNAGDAHVAGLVEAGPSVAIPSYGQVVEVSAIVGAGDRGGVDLIWGTDPVYGHFGLDLTGPNGGVVRIDDIKIEDATGVFHRDLMNWVDVRDFGAVGDGVTDDSAAFEAADAAANGRRVLVSSGTYFLGSSVTLSSRVQFEGTVAMPTEALFVLPNDFDLPTYIDAFGDEELAFKKAFQALLNNADHESLDLGGRRISITAPIDLQAAVPNRATFAQRRVIRNGQLRAESSSNWVPDVVTSTATYDGDNKTRLTNVTNVANVPVGSLVEGSGVGREIYVKSKNVAAQEITLSEALYDADGTQQYTFTRFKYILDFSGFDNLQDFTITDVEFQCQEEASGILIAPQGSIMQIRDCIFNRPGHRGITSHGGGCQGMLIDRCNFISAENGLLTQDRQSVAITGNSNDIKLRNNRASQFKHFAVLSGSYNMIIGNHFFQGDSANSGLRSAGIVLALRSCHATITGNYIDNCSIEWTNEREPDPDFTSGFGFAGLTVNNNVFLCSHVAEWFSFLIVKPHGTDHFINGLNVSGNAFRAVGVTINRVERVDTSFANLDHGKAKKITFTGNTFHNVENGCSNPLTVTHTQNTAASSWSVLTDSRLAFNGFAQEVEGLALRGDIRNSSNVRQFDTPYTLSEQGNNSNIVRVIFPEEVSGSVTLSIRADD